MSKHDWNQAKFIEASYAHLRQAQYDTQHLAAFMNMVEIMTDGAFNICPGICLAVRKDDE